MKDAGPPPPPNGAPLSDDEARREWERIGRQAETAARRLERVRDDREEPPPPAPDPDDWPLSTRLGCLFPALAVGGALVVWGTSSFGPAALGQVLLVAGLACFLAGAIWIWATLGIYAMTVAPFMDLRRSHRPIEALLAFVAHMAQNMGMPGRLFLVGFGLVLLGGTIRLAAG